MLRPQAQPPLLGIVLRMDDVRVRAVLEELSEHMDDAEELPRALAAWLYALLARLEKPIDADTSSAVRSLYRSCARIRAKQVGCGARLAGMN